MNVTFTTENARNITRKNTHHCTRAYKTLVTTLPAAPKEPVNTASSATSNCLAEYRFIWDACVRRVPRACTTSVMDPKTAIDAPRGIASTSSVISEFVLGNLDAPCFI